MILVFHKACSRLSDSEEDAKEKGTRKVRAFSIVSTVSSAPDYLGAWNRLSIKPGFHMSGKSQTIVAFTFCRPSQIYRIIATILSLILPMNLAGNGKCAKNWNLRDGGTEAQQIGGLVKSEIHRRRPRRYKFEFSFDENDRQPSQKSGTRRENRNAPDSPDLSPSISDDRGYLRFRVFISRQNLGQSGSSKIPDRLGFSRHISMKTRLKELEYKVEKSKYKKLEAMLSRIKNKSELPVGK